MRSALGAASALPLLCAAASVHAQLCDYGVGCASIDASGAYVLDEVGMLGYTIGSGAFVPDRRPIAVISPYNGTQARNDPFGFEFDYDCVSRGWLVNKLDEAWDLGFRRFFFNRPGGALENNGNGHVPQEHFQHLQNWLKNEYAVEVGQWIADKRLIDPAVEVGVFIGSTQNNPCNPCLDDSVDYYDCSGTDPLDTREMDAAIRDSAELTYKATRPWIDAGYNAIWFDASAGQSATGGNITPEALSVVAMAYNPDYAGVKVGGEAVPADYSGGVYTPDSYLTTNAAWVGLQRYHECRWPDGPGAVVFDPDTTEVVVAFNGTGVNPSFTCNNGTHPPYDIHTVGRYRDRGFVLASWREGAYKYIRRVDDGDEFYDALAADPSELADFNADGVVNCADYQLFVARWCANFLQQDDALSVWDGDVNNDDLVDGDDLAEFYTLQGMFYNVHTCLVSSCP